VSGGHDSALRLWDVVVAAINAVVTYLPAARTLLSIADPQG
jgi:hypothetical protein